MGQAVHFGSVEFRKHFDVLVVVDLEIGQQQPAVFAGRLVEAEGLLEAPGRRCRTCGRRPSRPSSNQCERRRRWQDVLTGAEVCARHMLDNKGGDEKDSFPGQLGLTVWGNDRGFMDRDSATGLNRLSRQESRVNKCPMTLSYVFYGKPRIAILPFYASP